MNLQTLKKVTLEALRKSYVSSKYEKKYLFNNAYKTRASMSIYIFFLCQVDVTYMPNTKKKMTVLCTFEVFFPTYDSSRRRRKKLLVSTNLPINLIKIAIHRVLREELSMRYYASSFSFISFSPSMNLGCGNTKNLYDCIQLVF